MSCDASCSNITLNTGATGANGATGNGWSHGSGAPSGAPSNNQVYYFDTSAGSVYFWNGGTWVSQFTYTGTNGVFGGYAQQYSYSSTTTSGTTAGQIRFNNANPLSATLIYLNDQDVNLVDTVFTATDLVAGDKVRIFNTSDSTKYILATLTNSATGVGEYEFVITSVEGSSGTIFNNGDSVAFSPVYTDPTAEDQTHALKTFNIDSGDGVSGTGAIAATQYVVDVDNISATIFQNTGDTLRFKYFLTGTKSASNSVTFRVNSNALVTGVFHDTILLIEADVIRVTDTAVDVIYKVYQNDMFQLAGRITQAVSNMTSNDLTFDLSATGASITVNNTSVEHIKYTSKTY